MVITELMRSAGRRVMLGVDLGKRQTPTTIVVVERQNGDRVWDNLQRCWMSSVRSEAAVVRWLESIPLGTSYDRVARRIWMVAEQSGAAEIWMDGTGVGVAVEEMIAQRKPTGIRCILRSVMITGGQQAHSTSVPRKELLTRLAVEWQQGRVKVAAGLSNWPELRKELLALDGHGQKRHGRDDLALGLALAVWGLKGSGATVGERDDGRLL